MLRHSRLISCSVGFSPHMEANHVCGLKPTLQLTVPGRLFLFIFHLSGVDHLLLFVRRHDFIVTQFQSE